MSNVINDTIYSSVENGRFKLKKRRNLWTNCTIPISSTAVEVNSFPWYKATDLKKHPQRTTYPKQFIRVCGVPILLSLLVYHLQKNQPNRIMQHISSWSKVSSALPSVSPQNNYQFGLLYAPESTILSLRFWHFSEGASPRTPCKAHKRMIVPAVVCIRNYCKKIGFNCWIHHCSSQWDGS